MESPAHLGINCEGPRARQRVADGRAYTARPLSPRQAQVLSHVAEGLTNKEIAKRLSISINTVKTRLRELHQILGLRNRVELAVWRVRNGA